MEKRTALIVAGALTLTVAAGTSALAVTLGAADPSSSGDDVGTYQPVASTGTVVPTVVVVQDPPAFPAATPGSAPGPAPAGVGLAAGSAGTATPATVGSGDDDRIDDHGADDQEDDDHDEREHDEHEHEEHDDDDD